MKKLFFACFVTIMSISNVSSQEFGVGAGLTLGTEISIDDDFSSKLGFGANVRGLYKFTPRWGVTGGFTYYFPSTPSQIDLTTYQFNFDATYSIVNNQIIDFYGLLGIDTAYAKAEVPEENMAADDNELGIELGIGLVTKFGLFFEAKAEGAYEQGQFTLGYLHRF